MRSNQKYAVEKKMNSWNEMEFVRAGKSCGVGKGGEKGEGNGNGKGGKFQVKK